MSVSWADAIPENTTTMMIMKDRMSENPKLSSKLTRRARGLISSTLIRPSLARRMSYSNRQPTIARSDFPLLDELSARDDKHRPMESARRTDVTRDRHQLVAGLEFVGAGCLQDKVLFVLQHL